MKIWNWLFKSRQSNLIYRKVVDRTRTPDGEIVTMDCGHRYLLQRMERAELPCEECVEAKRKMT